jgi:hypothetical protein
VPDNAQQRDVQWHLVELRDRLLCGTSAPVLRAYVYRNMRRQETTLALP